MFNVTNKKRKGGYMQKCNYEYKTYVVLLYLVVIIAMITFFSILKESPIIGVEEAMIILFFIAFNIIRIMVTDELSIEIIYYLAFYTVFPFILEISKIRIELIIAAVVTIGFPKKTLIRRIVISLMLLTATFTIVCSPGKNEENVLSTELNVQATEIDINTLKEGLSDLHSLSLEQKLRLCKDISRYECKKLGVPLIEIACEKSKGSEKGYFRWGERANEIKIAISKSFLEQVIYPEELLEVVCHEVYHWKQYNETKAYETSIGRPWENLEIFSDAKIYFDEVRNYQDAEVDYELYANQLIETKAREYASGRVLDYMENRN